jgi:hypothetical protein
LVEAPPGGGTPDLRFVGWILNLICNHTHPKNGRHELRRSKLDTPHVRERAVKELSTGNSQSAIAKGIGLNQSQVSRWSNRADIKKLLEEEQKRMLSATPDAVQNFIDVVQEDVLKARELQLKASEVVLKTGGIIPSIHSQTLNLYQEKPILTPNIAKFLDFITRHITADPDEMCT